MWEKIKEKLHDRQMRKQFLLWGGLSLVLAIVLSIAVSPKTSINDMPIRYIGVTAQNIVQEPPQQENSEPETMDYIPTVQIKLLLSTSRRPSVLLHLSDMFQSLQE